MSGNSAWQPDDVASTAAFAASAPQLDITEQVIAQPVVEIEQKTKPGEIPRWLITASGWSWRLIALVAGLAVIVYAINRVRLAFIGLFIAAVLTAVLRPLRDRFARRMSQGKAVLAAYAVAVAVVAAIAAYVAISARDEWPTVGQHFNAGFTQIIQWFNDGPLHLHLPFDETTDAVAEARNWLGRHEGTLAEDAAHRLGLVFDVAGMVTLAIFCSVYFLSSGRSMWQWIVSQFPTKHRKKLNKSFTAGWQAFAGYARGTAIIALAEGLLAGVFFTIARVPLAAPLAIVIAIGTVIPIFGKPVAMIIATVVALAADGPMRAVIVLVGIFVLNQLEERILEPLIYARTVSLHPVVVAMGVMTGTLVGGIFGAILAVPVISVVWSIYKALRPHHPDVGSVKDKKKHNGALSKLINKILGDGAQPVAELDMALVPSIEPVEITGPIDRV